MHEPAAMRRLPVMEGLLERIEYEARHARFVRSASRQCAAHRRL